MLAAAIEMASLIASKSPVAVQVSKLTLNYSRDHTVDDSLDYVASFFPVTLLGIKVRGSKALFKVLPGPSSYL